MCIRDREKIAPLMRHKDNEDPIIMDNVNKVVLDNVNANVLGVKASNISKLTSYFDHKSNKWLESKRASHPFISVKMTKINPKKNNKDDSATTTQCVMADSGAMCSLLNFKMVEDMGIVPENLETSNVSITGVNGKKLQSVTRQMHLKIVNTKNGAESWEKVYVSPEIKTSLVSKDCLIRLKIIDPKQFLSDSEVSSFSVNTVDESKEKLSECEKSFFQKEDGTTGCKCDRRVSPPEFEEPFYRAAIKKLKTLKGDLPELLAKFLKGRFKSSSMNICQTQSLPMMPVSYTHLTLPTTPYV